MKFPKTRYENNLFKSWGSPCLKQRNKVKLQKPMYSAHSLRYWKWRTSART